MKNNTLTNGKEVVLKYGLLDKTGRHLHTSISRCYVLTSLALRYYKKKVVHLKPAHETDLASFGDERGHFLLNLIDDCQILPDRRSFRFHYRPSDTLHVLSASSPSECQSWFSLLIDLGVQESKTTQNQGKGVHEVGNDMQQSSHHRHRNSHGTKEGRNESFKQISPSKINTNYDHESFISSPVKKTRRVSIRERLKQRFDDLKTRLSSSSSHHTTRREEHRSIGDTHDYRYRRANWPNIISISVGPAQAPDGPPKIAQFVDWNEPIRFDIAPVTKRVNAIDQPQVAWLFNYFNVGPDCAFEGQVDQEQDDNFSVRLAKTLWKLVTFIVIIVATWFITLNVIASDINIYIQTRFAAIFSKSASNTHMQGHVSTQKSSLFSPHHSARTRSKESILVIRLGGQRYITIDRDRLNEIRKRGWGGRGYEAQTGQAFELTFPAIAADARLSLNLAKRGAIRLLFEPEMTKGGYYFNKYLRPFCLACSPQRKRAYLFAISFVLMISIFSWVALGSLSPSWARCCFWLVAMLSGIIMCLKHYSIFAPFMTPLLTMPCMFIVTPVAWCPEPQSNQGRGNEQSSVDGDSVNRLSQKPILMSALKGRSDHVAPIGSVNVEDLLDEESQAEAVQMLRKKVNSTPHRNDIKSDDAALRRILRARGFKVDKAFAQWQKWIEWRTEFNVDSQCTEFKVRKELDACLAYWYGCDAHQRPCCIMLPRNYRPKHHTVKSVIRYGVYMVEKGIDLAEKNGVEQFCVIWDRAHSSSKNLDMKLMTALIDLVSVLQDCYAERLGAVYILNVNLFFWMCYKVVSPMLSKATRSKIHILKGKKTLLDHFAPEQLQRCYGGESTFPTPESTILSSDEEKDDEAGEYSFDSLKAWFRDKFDSAKEKIGKGSDDDSNNDGKESSGDENDDSSDSDGPFSKARRWFNKIRNKDNSGANTLQLLEEDDSDIDINQEGNSKDKRRSKRDKYKDKDREGRTSALRRAKLWFNKKRIKAGNLIEEEKDEDSPDSDNEEGKRASKTDGTTFGEGRNLVDDRVNKIVSGKKGKSKKGWFKKKKVPQQTDLNSTRRSSVGVLESANSAFVNPSPDFLENLRRGDSNVTDADASTISAPKVNERSATSEGKKSSHKPSTTKQRSDGGTLSHHVNPRHIYDEGKGVLHRRVLNRRILSNDGKTMVVHKAAPIDQILNSDADIQGERRVDVVDFSGVWELDKDASDNMNHLLKRQGVNWFLRKTGGLMNSTYIITQTPYTLSIEVKHKMHKGSRRVIPYGIEVETVDTDGGHIVELFDFDERGLELVGFTSSTNPKGSPTEMHEWRSLADGGDTMILHRCYIEYNSDRPRSSTSDISNDGSSDEKFFIGSERRKTACRQVFRRKTKD